MATPTRVAVGTPVRGAGAITPAWPAGVQANDVGLLFVETANQAPSLSTPAGFAQAAQNGTGTAGTSAATMLTLFWCRAGTSNPANPTVADSGDHQTAFIAVFRGCITTGNPWDVLATAVQASAQTGYSIPTVTTTVAETLVLLALSNNGDVTQNRVPAPPTNAALAPIVRLLDTQPDPAVSNILRVGPYTGLSNSVGAGPGGDFTPPYYRLAGINPHQLSDAELQAAIDTADALDITLIATTPDATSAFGSNTSAGFDFAAYKAKIDKLVPRVGFKDAVQRGRILCLAGDEPYHPKWTNSAGQATWTPNLVNQCGRYHKDSARFGSNAYVIFRADLDKLSTGDGGGWNNLPLPAGGVYDAVDYGCYQFEGPSAQAHITFAAGLATARTQAASCGVGVFPAINLWGGGNHVTVAGVPACWDTSPFGGSASGVIAGSVQGSPSPYAIGQKVDCATWNATATAGKKTLVCSPAWLQAIIDSIYNDPDIPWLGLWTYASSTLAAPFVPVQNNAVYVAGLDYVVNKALTRPSANPLPSPKP